MRTPPHPEAERRLYRFAAGTQDAAQPAILGLHSLDPIRPGEEANVVTRPVVTFRGDRIYIPKVCSAFDVRDIRVGMNSYFINTVPIPAEAFGECPSRKSLAALRRALGHPGKILGEHPRRNTSVVPLRPAEQVAALRFGAAIRMQTCQVAMDFGVRVFNRGPRPVVFQAAVFGVMLDG